MARSEKPVKIQKAIRSLSYIAADGVNYLDIMKDLSVVNRRLYPQGMCLGIESIEFYNNFPLTGAGAIDTVILSAYTAGDTWSVHNAHVKGEALWNQMNDLVLEDNPSVQGKWADFKVFLDGAHRGSVYSGVGNLVAIDGQGNAYQEGEWEYSDYVLPQHDVDPATGFPKVADQCNAHLVGPTLGAAGAFASIGLVQEYADSRATVSPDQPNVPGAMPTSFFNLLTDSGSQEPELATIIEQENDNPPYDLNNYAGGGVNAVYPILSEFGAATIGSPMGTLTPFVAQCGLIKLNVAGSLNGISEPTTGLLIRVNVMPGTFKGVAAIPMGQ